MKDYLLLNCNFLFDDINWYTALIAYTIQLMSYTILQHYVRLLTMIS